MLTSHVGYYYWAVADPFKPSYFDQIEDLSELISNFQQLLLYN